jgi:hypothetical protein
MQDTPIRVGVFTHLDAADDAVRGLVDAGFSEEHIAVICSDDDTHHERLEHFRQVEPGHRSEKTAIAGGAIGATLGGLAAIGGGLATGGIGLVAAGLAAMWAGGVAGGLIGAMASRGLTKEYADYYDQAVADGKVLVAVEYHGTDQMARLIRAERVFEAAGAEPVELTEG